MGDSFVALPSIVALPYHGTVPLASPNSAWPGRVSALICAHHPGREMLTMRLVLFAALSFTLASAGRAGVPDASAVLDHLAITVTPDHPREFIFSDKGAAHLAGVAVGQDTRSYHGLTIAMHEVLDGWSLRLEDGRELTPAGADSAVVRPDRLVRHHGGITETVTLLDRSDGLRIVYDGVPSGAFGFVPRVDMRFLWHVARPAYRAEFTGGVLRIARADRQAAAAGERTPPWLAVLVSGAADHDGAGRYMPRSYPIGEARRAMQSATPWEAGAVRGRIPARVQEGRVEVIIAAGAGSDDAAARAYALQADADRLAAERAARLADLADPARLSTGVPEDDRALAWARISLDNLVMEQRGPGIYAGFYWFTTYWGRDTFIVLPGAMAAGLPAATAREILRSFAAFQDRDPDSPRFGRVPNFVTVDQVQYASIDGTWWFVRALDEYWRRTGDHAFARDMMPVVLRACEGAQAHAVDAEGFLTHGDGETWMDGGGEANPYSPRGDRAVEVQALWHRGLQVAARLARRFDGRVADLNGEDLARRYEEAAARLRDGFRRRFVVDGRVVDHLNRDGSHDAQDRPNGLLALLASPDLFTPAMRTAVVAENAEHTVTDWGVRSLSAVDPDYHPRHLWLERYYYDEAYHNGDVWLWLSGAWVSALPDPREGFGQTRMLLDEILREGAVGTLQEIRDGDRAASNDEFGGATSQAWSLSELLRNVSEDYLGVRVDLAGDEPRIVIAPRAPRAWPRLAGEVPVGLGATLRVAVDADDVRWELTGDGAEALRPFVRVVADRNP
jgi:glycogen debranching enzyme